MQDQLATPEIAGALGPDAAFADISVAVFIDRRAALGALAQAFLAGKVNGFGGLTLAWQAEVEFRQLVVVEADFGVERTAHLVAEAGERADLAFAQ